MTISEEICDKADEEFFESVKNEYGADIRPDLLEQFRLIRQPYGRTAAPGTKLEPLPENFVPRTFLEYLEETSKHDIKSLLTLAAKETHKPILEPDILPTGNTPCYDLEDLPMVLLYKSNFGTATFIHCVPFLEKSLESITVGDEENAPTAYDILRRNLGALKLHFVLCTPKELFRLKEKMRGNGKILDGSFASLKTLPEGNLRPNLLYLETLELLPKHKPGEARLEEWDTTKVNDILAQIKSKRPKEDAASRTEWTSITTDTPFLSLDNTPAQEKLNSIFSAMAQKRHECFPLHMEGNLLTLACHKIPTVQTRSEMTASMTQRAKLHFILASHSQVMTLINKSMSAKVNLQTIAEDIEHEDHGSDISNEQIDIEALIKQGKDEETTVIQLLRGLIVQAVQDKATDIHVASAATHLNVRFRIDGNLIPYPHPLPRGLDRPLITRIKIISDINTQKTGMPEDGKFTTKIGGLEYEIRVTTCPTVHGEKAVMRVQPKTSHIPTLESLGFQGIEKQVIVRTIEADHGLLVICGPTGSGKSTTLYAAIGIIDRVQWNVITGEQPVEIKIPNCEQTAITGNLTFAKFVTATLRQDPDYIMIGETRDVETTEELIRAAITGHNVMTTLHTNSAPSAPSRLIDLGAKPYLLADALVGVCAQRLLRRLCTNCMQKVPVPASKKIQELGIREDWLLGASSIYQPVGCKMCRGTGYAGRVAVIEGYTMNHEIQDIIQNKNANPRSIQAVMEAQGSKSLFQHAVENVGRGVCSLTDAMGIQSIH